jgi:transcriptional regulator with XRE-family HTH domain
MTGGGHTWDDVATRVQTRLVELGVTLKELERQSGVSDSTWRKLLRGEPITRPDKKRQICEGLRWTSDSIDRILNGGDPMVIGADAAGLADQVAMIQAEMMEQRELLEELRDAVQALGSGPLSRR